MSDKTSQVEFWRGEFGDSYTDRNAPTEAQLSARTAMWTEILACMADAPPASILEVGANLGINLRTLSGLTGATLMAIEPNAYAREMLVTDGVVTADKAHDGVADAIHLPDGAVDMAFTSGVLIHIHPDSLLSSCREIHRVARRYIVCIEYFAQNPEEVAYRGHSSVLFKRDFGGFWLDHFSDLKVLGYGFVWKRVTGLDDLTWWVFEKE